DPVGTTLQGVAPAVGFLGAAVGAAGQTVSALDKPQLGLVGDVAGLAGGTVQVLGTTISGLEGTVAHLTNNQLVSGLTTQVGQVVTPVLSTVLGTTQNLVQTAGLAQPVNNLLGTV